MKEVIELLLEAQRSLEDFPEGGIGADGPTCAQLVEMVEKTGACYGDNSTSHGGQWAWRHIQKAIELLEKLEAERQDGP